MNTEVSIVPCGSYEDAAAEEALRRVLEPIGGLDFVQPSNSLFPDIVGFFDGRPEIEVSFHTEAGMDFLRALRQQQVDLVLDRLPTEDYLAGQSEYVSVPLVRERQCVLLAHRDPLAGRESLSIGELEGSTVISGLENSAEDRQLSRDYRSSRCSFGRR